MSSARFPNSPAPTRRAPARPARIRARQARHRGEKAQSQARMVRPDGGRQHHPVGDGAPAALEDPRSAHRAQQARARHRRVGLGQDVQLRRPQPAPALRLLRRHRPQGRHAQAVRQLLPAPRLRPEGGRPEGRTRPYGLDALQPPHVHHRFDLDHPDREPARREHHRRGQAPGRERGLLREGRAPALYGPHRLPALLLRRPARGPHVQRDGEPAPDDRGRGGRAVGEPA